MITTNFDRLLEKALEEIGVTPIVISTLDAVEGALPLGHSKCPIVKPRVHMLKIYIYFLM